MTVFDAVRSARAAERLYRDHARELEQELARVEGKLTRVEALHQPSPEQVDDAGVAYRLCLHCTYINRYGRQRYPCPTITALNEGASK